MVRCGVVAWPFSGGIRRGLATPMGLALNVCKGYIGGCIGGPRDRTGLCYRHVEDACLQFQEGEHTSYYSSLALPYVIGSYVHAFTQLIARYIINMFAGYNNKVVSIVLAIAKV